MDTESEPNCFQLIVFQLSNRIKFCLSWLGAGPFLHVSNKEKSLNTVIKISYCSDHLCPLPYLSY